MSVSTPAAGGEEAGAMHTVVGVGADAQIAAAHGDRGRRQPGAVAQLVVGQPFAGIERRRLEIVLPDQLVAGRRHCDGSHGGESAPAANRPARSIIRPSFLYSISHAHPAASDAWNGRRGRSFAPSNRGGLKVRQEEIRGMREMGRSMACRLRSRHPMGPAPAPARMEPERNGRAWRT